MLLPVAQNMKLLEFRLNITWQPNQPHTKPEHIYLSKYYSGGEGFALLRAYLSSFAYSSCMLQPCPSRRRTYACRQTLMLWCKRSTHPRTRNIIVYFPCAWSFIQFSKQKQKHQEREWCFNFPTSTKQLRIQTTFILHAVSYGRIRAVLWCECAVVVVSFCI